LDHLCAPLQLQRSTRSRIYAAEERSPSGCVVFDLALHPLGEKQLDERLVRDIPLVSQALDLVEQEAREAQRDRLQRRLEVRKSDSLGLGPVDELGRILRGPECALLVFVGGSTSFSRQG
jgi:hypothetical protein